jgi:DNA-binding transcriptional regulator YbjK
MTQHRRAVRRYDAASVRERILAAAVALLHEEGIQGWSQIQVARRAKVRQSHVTYYFPKRHDLVDAVAQHVTGGMALALRGVLESSEERDVGPVLRRLAGDIAARQHMRMFTGLIVEADHDPKLRAILVRWTLSLQETLATALGGQGATERSRIILAALWGFGLYEFAMRPSNKLDLTDSFLACLAGGTRTAARPYRPSSGGRGAQRAQ